MEKSELKYNNPRAWLDKLSYALEKKLYYMGFCSEIDWDNLLSKWDIMISKDRLGAEVVRIKENNQDALKLPEKTTLFFEISDPYNRTKLNIERRYLYIPEELAEKIVIFEDLP